ncbi:MAG TPA: alkaline phosphatase family protein [Bryobacteraceae bacterium]|nr:alkaline phosphatase family protein [Bryobacteraceae bacterium]
MHWKLLLTAGLGLASPLASVLAQTTTPTTPIEHVVVIFQENVSFDHYFATYPVAANPGGQPVFVPQNIGGHPTPTVNGLIGPLMTHNPNSTQPFRLDRTQAVICDQDHDYTAEQKAMDGGAMDQFVNNLGQTAANCNDAGKGKGLVMGFYDGNTVTALWNYAQYFALSDNFFSTEFGPSTLGHLNLVSGQTNGVTVVRDTGTAASVIRNGTLIGDIRPALDDCSAATANTVTMSGPNVGDLLNQKKVTWGWFAGGFAPSSRNADGTAVCNTQHTLFDGSAPVADYVANHEPFQFYQSTANPHHMPATSVAMIGQTDQANHQYDISDFFKALDAGNLPAVSFLKAPAYEDGHAGYSDPLDEQTFLVTTINRLQESAYWKSTAVIITWDDSDGLYDHAMPPIVSGSATDADALNGQGACGAQPSNAPTGRCGYGQRLPLLVVSHFARVNYVDHAITDQTSILRFIEDNWNLGQIGGTSFDAMAGSIKTMFDFENGGTARKLLLEPTSGLPQ